MTALPAIHSLRDGAVRAIRAADLDVKTLLAQEDGAPLERAQPFPAFAAAIRTRSRSPRPARKTRSHPADPGRRSGRLTRRKAGSPCSTPSPTSNSMPSISRSTSSPVLQAKPVPNSFFDGWMRVAFEEAKHFRMVRDRLRQLGADYGDLPAHDGLWQAAHDTRNDLTARLAVVPLILEARGLDVTPALQAKMREAGDLESAAVLDVIYEDEKGHVAVGAKWFRFLCARQKKDPAAAFQALVRANFRGPLKAPFNDIARAEAGLTPSFYRSMTAS